MESRIPFKPQDNAVLLIHGLAGSSLEVARLGQILQQSGLTVHGPDIPGFAYATQETPWQDWAAFARKEYQRLANDYQTVSVVGVSMGATLALELASHEQVTALVLLSAAMGYDGWATPWYRFLLPVANLIPFHNKYRFHESEPFGVKNPALRAMVKKMLAERKQSVVGGESISLEQLLQGDALIRQVRSRLDLINDPLLILHPVEDEAVHPRHAQFIYDNVSSEDKELILLGDCYHMITVDNERDTVFYETDMFIKRCINARLGKMVFDVPQQLVRSLDRLAKWSQAQGA